LLVVPKNGKSGFYLPQWNFSYICSFLMNMGC
jgi:hypothetical protein